MAWVKIDDNFAHHEKVLAAGPEGLALDLAGMCYAARHSTGGFIPDAMVPALYPPLVRTAERVAKTLAKVDRWERDDSRHGYWVHDFLEYNPMADPAEAARRSELAQRAANARWNAPRMPDGKLVASDPHAERTAAPDAPPHAESRARPGTRGHAGAAPLPSPSGTYNSSSSYVGRVESDDDDHASLQETTIDAACLLLAGRDLARREAEKGAVGDPPKWVESARIRRRDKHLEAATQLLADRPDLDAEALAQLLDPPAVNGPGDSTQRATTAKEARDRELASLPPCEPCGSTGWVWSEEPGEIVVCGDCERVPAAAGQAKGNGQ